MKWMKSILFLGLVVFLFSCESEEECIGCNLNPKVKLKFEAKGKRQLYDSLFSRVNTRISLLNDSLGLNLTGENRTAVLNALVMLRADSAKYDDALSLYEVGKTRIDEIFAPGAEEFTQFSDSVIRDFSIPVNMNWDTSTYYFSYHELVDTLQIFYQREITQSLDGVRMRLSGIGVNEEITTFDSVKVNCFSRTCGNDLTTIHVYF